METVIALLREKNHQLEKFYWVNEQELINFGAGNFDTVEEFYQARESLLQRIAVIDEHLEPESKLVSGDISPEQRAEIEALLKAKDELVKAILDQDLKILEYIEREKSNIIRELKATVKARKAVGAYANSERMRHLDQE